MSREDIPAASVQRLLRTGASGKIRISTPAVQKAHSLVQAYLAKAGRDAAKISKAAKMQTIKDRHAQLALLDVCAGVSEEDLGHVDHKKRGLPVAGVSRVFREAAGNIRVSAEVEKMSTAAAEAFLATLGRRAAMIAQAAKRQTLLEADIVAAHAF